MWYARLKTFLKPTILITWIAVLRRTIAAFEALGIVVPAPLRPLVTAVLAILSVMLGFAVGLTEVDEAVSGLESFAVWVDDVCEQINIFS